MPIASVQSYVSVGGVSVQSTLTRSGSGQLSHEVSLPVGSAASLTTRTDTTDGTITLPAGHAIATGKVDLVWAGGSRYGVDAVVTVNACAITGGAGDDLPALLAAVVVAVPIVIDTDFAGDLIELLVAQSSSRSTVVLQTEAGAVLLALSLLANEAYQWASGQGANPLAGDSVGKIVVSNGDAVNVGDLKIGVLYDSVS